MTDTMTGTPTTPAWTVPTSLSPSRVESFLSCPLAFRFASIEKLPDPPTVATTRGSLVHRALELLTRTARRLKPQAAADINQLERVPQGEVTESQ